jgi:cytochrome c556
MPLKGDIMTKLFALLIAVLLVSSVAVAAENQPNQQDYQQAYKSLSEREGMLKQRIHDSLELDAIQEAKQTVVQKAQAQATQKQKEAEKEVPKKHE